MIISLIGMSGSGKSFLASELASYYGFEAYICDKTIEQKLESQLKGGGHSGLSGVAQWMGLPCSEGYSQREAAYLNAEREVMEDTLETLANKPPSNNNYVIDTTGSFVYLGDVLCRRLKALSTVIYIEIPRYAVDDMFAHFVKHPKPLIWGGLFEQRNGESEEDAFRRSLPKLLDYRLDRYKKYAHITIPHRELTNPAAVISRILSLPGIA